MADEPTPTTPSPDAADAPDANTVAADANAVAAEPSTVAGTAGAADGPAPDAPAAPLNTEQPIMVWEAKEYAEYERNHRWYVAVAVIGAVLSLGMLVDAVFFSNGLRESLSSVLVAVVFALATYVVMKHAGDPPRTITYSITKLGLHVGEKFRPYNELKTFWIIYKPPVSTLYLQTINRFHPLIKIDLGDVDPLAIKNTLKEYLPEEQKREEDFIEKFSRMIRL